MVHLKIRVPNDSDLDVGGLYGILNSKLSASAVGACTMTPGKDSIIYDFFNVEVQSGDVIGKALNNCTMTTLADLHAILDKSGATIIN